MDLASIGAAAPTLGGATILVVIVGILLRMLHLSSEELTRVRAAYSTEIDRVNRVHDEEFAEQAKVIDDLRARQDRLEARFDEERERRRQAEDALAEARRIGGSHAS